ncbi:MAG TPA: sterol desaturase family protein, partial [Pseudomonadales bacterium]|nr:sterol desaturase family protein [Pseudomonadales bacterium]
SPLDKFGAILNTPSHHRVHHGNQPLQIDTNFGGILIIWDKLFGTFRAEADAGEIRYGIVERQPHSLNPFYLQLHEWIDMFKDYSTSKDWRVFIKAPGWVSDKGPAR